MGLFGPEKITLMLEKYEYKPGETIKGTVNLKLKKPTLSRKLEIDFIGEKPERRTHTTRDSHGHTHTHTDTVYVPIYHSKIQLDGEKEYFEGTYPLEIKIPEEIATFIPVQIPNSLVKISNPIRWYIKVQLDVPMRLDVKKAQDITISR